MALPLLTPYCHGNDNGSHGCGPFELEPCRAGYRMPHMHPHDPDESEVTSLVGCNLSNRDIVATPFQCAMYNDHHQMSDRANMHV